MAVLSSRCGNYTWICFWSSTAQVPRLDDFCAAIGLNHNNKEPIKELVTGIPIPYVTPMATIITACLGPANVNLTTHPHAPPHTQPTRAALQTKRHSAKKVIKTMKKK